jgi:hypothetical protein
MSKGSIYHHQTRDRHQGLDSVSFPAEKDKNVYNFRIFVNLYLSVSQSGCFHHLKLLELHGREAKSWLQAPASIVRAFAKHAMLRSMPPTFSNIHSLLQPTRTPFQLDGVFSSCR